MAHGDRHDDGIVDLRSDTVTRPTPEMRRAMADADVGDDVYGEDPTVNLLQEEFAARLGKDAALYVPSGTMANQLALRLHTRPGTIVVAGRRNHIVAYEDGAGARNAAVQFLGLDDESGVIDPAAVALAVESVKHHQPAVTLVALEDTHMASGGRPADLEQQRAVATVATGAGLPVHLDGARLFNAEVATGVAAAERAAVATTVMCCMSKGLCAPVGSLLAGPADVIEAAFGERHALGGAMRQAGVIAAAGLVGLRTMVERLADDHARARRLATAAAERWPDCGLDPDQVRTNLVVFRPPDSDGLLAHLDAHGIRAGTLAPGVVRLVTHRDVDDADIERACKAIAVAP
jgi:threonine aldolase